MKFRWLQGVLLTSLMALTWCPDGWAWFGARSGLTVLVIPARPRVIQLAMDLKTIQPVEVIAYRGNAKTAEPYLFRWTGADWSYVSLQEFAGKTFTTRTPAAVALVGDAQALPPVIAQSVDWCKNVMRLETLNVAELLNSLAPALQLKERDWKWLAARYNLDLIDANAERRDHNPYNVPRSKLPVDTGEFKAEPGEPAPAQVIEDESLLHPAVLIDQQKDPPK